MDLPEASETLYQNAGNEVVSVRLQNGSGSVTGQLFYQTYRWLLEGEREAYNHFWVDYLNRVVKLEKSQIEITPMIPRRNEEAKIFITQPSEISEVVIKPVFSTDSLRIPISQYPENVNVVTASIWPYDSGWHFAEYGNRKTWFYVYGGRWEQDASIRKYKETKRLITSFTATAEAGSSKSRIPDWIWLIGFLLLQAILWAEKKIT
ncbi:MAG: hypothetical protein U5Q16_16260 [Gammaproteobacteria bacterium]|nr:hypothetical protein [Gammaproteobacteria bacterium]